MTAQIIDRVVRQVSDLTGEMTEFLQAITRVPTVNPPGECYADFAEVCSKQYEKLGYGVERVVAEGHPDHTAKHPRVNLLARIEGAGDAPCVHFNGHLDVVPAGAGWTYDPFGGQISGGRLYGRG